MRMRPNRGVGMSCAIGTLRLSRMLGVVEEITNRSRQDSVMNAGGVPSAGVTVAPALVRLLDADGVGRGLALLIADREIVTCAHVVNLALGLSDEPPQRPSAPVQLDFP